jgi:signal transduction histidine kinase/ligand-binding sensor domain-containing protein/DNA-binding response OmpR family regulator
MEANSRLHFFAGIKMFRLKCMIVFTLLGLVEVVGQHPVVKLQFKQITSIHGLSNNTVYDITQDGEGFIWIATREGLNKFDGEVITTYYRGDVKGIPGNFIERLLVTSQEQLLVGTQQGACVYHKTTDSFEWILDQGRSLGDLFQMIELSSGKVLIASVNGLFKLDDSLRVTKISDLIFRDLCEYRSGIFWGAQGDEILVMNAEGEIIRRYTNEVESTQGLDLSAENIECIYRDSRDIIWLGTKRDGLSYYDDQADLFTTIGLNQGVNPVEDNFIRVISEDATGRLWIGTESGLYIYDLDAKAFEFYGRSFIPVEKGLNDKAIYSIFRSSDDLMWIGTYFGGVNYTSLNNGGFNRIYADGGRRGLSGNAVSEIIETADGRLWIGTEDGGISILDPGTGSYEYLKHIPGDPGSLASNNVHALEEDSRGNIWIGTFIGGLHKYHSRTGAIENVELVPPMLEMKEDVYSKSIFSILIDARERTWVGSIQGLYMREAEDEPFRLWKPDHFAGNFVYHIEEDSSGTLWVCTYEQGIYRIDRDMQVTNYRSGTNHDIISDRIVYCYVDKNDVKWFGTVEGGLIKFDGKQGRFTSYTEEHGLPNNTVYAITRDREGFLWFSTNRGLSRFDTNTEVIVNYSEDDGLIGNQFNFKSGLSTSEGILYFGAVNGLSFFNPSALRSDTLIPELHFTALKIFNNPVMIGEEEILTSHINYQDQLPLRHNHKVFTIEFVALNYTSPGKTRYAFFLEGLEEEWNFVGNKHNATYTNLSPGNYIFHVMAASGDHAWGSNERRLVIHISPPFWISPWGLVLYAVLLISTVLLIVRFYLIRQKDRMNVRLARLEKQKNEEISRHRLNFFTYISHEFKTPLTLIIATLDHMMNYEEILPKFRNYGLLMKKNAMRLLFLINQLMDFRKIETDHAALRFNRGDLIGFIRSTFETFYPLMEGRSIVGRFTSSVDSYIVYFDADKLEKILTNLISNACKSFREPGTIEVDVRISERTHLADPGSNNGKTGDMIISVVDDGPGLPPEKVKMLFEPFVAEHSDIHSSGIGLSLVNSLVRYLNGEIQVKSNPKGGTAVSIQLPLIHHPSPELIKDDSFIDSNTSLAIENTALFLDSQPEVILNFGEDGTMKEYDLLIVEDNRELASFLQNHYSVAFKVHVAQNGLEALKKIRKGHPDLIISDIIMPGMDGFTLCNSVKDSLETSHIPVILLTSRSNDEARIEGLSRGADAYVAKPFNLRELDLQVRNILRARQEFRKHFMKLASMSDTVKRLGNKDQMFIRKLTETVLRYLDDGTFDVDRFCRELNISRTLMHTKLKKITGLTTTEFIKKIRLNEAQKMLREGNMTVSEIAYRVGFNDPAYFSKSYKKQFGKIPSSVLKAE